LEKKKLDQTVKTVLTNQFYNKYNLIKEHVEALWESHSGPPWHTLHDASHSLKVVDLIFQLMPEETHKRRRSLSNKEWFYLLTSAWLHDVGMIKGLLKRQDDFDTIRKTHHTRSAQYVKKVGQILRLDPSDVTIIQKLCTFHRKNEDILLCPDLFDDVRIRLLAAYLRLADGLHIDRSRVPESRYQLLKAAGMPWESRFHWMKSKWVTSVRPDFENYKIIVNVIDNPDNGFEQGILVKSVEREICDELYNIKDILTRANIACYLDVETKTIQSELEENDKVEYEIVSSNIEISQMASASSVSEKISRTIITIIESMPPSEAFPILTDYIKQVESVLHDRPSHIQIKSLITQLNSFIQNKNDNPDHISKKVSELARVVTENQGVKEGKLPALAKNATTFFLDGGNIFLFGYSTTILKCLEVLPRETKLNTEIYVGEGREKTVLSNTNEVIYCDGLNYAISLTKIGFSNISIVPDICVGNLMERRMIAKVVFGANCITNQCAFLQSSGHLTVAALANKYKIPVYVIADSSKFGVLDPNKDSTRDSNWLSCEKKILGYLQQYRIKTYNPRDDIVPPDEVTMIITELGAFPPTQIPEALSRKFVTS
jgi:translation initiation factor 2B subunit (eIF-2B alpha/beta/delta family)